MAVDGKIIERHFAMCGIAGIFCYKSAAPLADLSLRLEYMNRMQKHRGPDDDGIWTDAHNIGLAHVRLSIIDLLAGKQPMVDVGSNLVIVYNGEIYNYKELRATLSQRHAFHTHSDTEVILKAYLEWGEECAAHLRGMFAFAIWDERQRRLFLARDRFGIKPLYYFAHDGIFYFASELKALLPFVSERRIWREALREYLAFQWCLPGKTLFRDIHALPSAHVAWVTENGIRQKRYWELRYILDWDHTDQWFQRRCRELIEDSVRSHIVSDVPVGAYISGGLDSTAIAILARRLNNDKDFMVFHGRFDYGKRYDESQYARQAAAEEGMQYNEITITPESFPEVFDKIIYYLDYPVAGPGSFPQYMVSSLVRGKRKTILGGQGGDEIFGGYIRYLIAYFEQCFKGAICGVDDPQRFIVTYVSIIQNLTSLQGYEPLLRHFFARELFADYDRRYYRLINRAEDLGNAIYWEALGDYDPYMGFREVYFSNEIGKRCYFDSMLHFDFVTLLPALLHVEDRMSMAHGIEARTPFLDHPLVEFVATIPANIKFLNGELKRLPRRVFEGILPPAILRRKDKMGFPVPLVEWLQNKLRYFVEERIASPCPAATEFLNYKEIERILSEETSFGRNIWGFLCLDSFFRQFIDSQSSVILPFN